MSQSRIGKKRGPMTDETKRKISDSKQNIPQETLLKMSIAAQNRPAPSSNTKLKISKKLKGRILPKQECPHCNRAFDPGNYKQHHGDNCKLKL